jgi:hypothetical protein
MDRRKNEERVVNAFETWSWGRMLKINWTDRIMSDEVLQRAKEERFTIKSSTKQTKQTPLSDRTYN